MDATEVCNIIFLSPVADVVRAARTMAGAAGTVVAVTLRVCVPTCHHFTRSHSSAK